MKNLMNHYTYYDYIYRQLNYKIKPLENLCSKAACYDKTKCNITLKANLFNNKEISALFSKREIKLLLSNDPIEIVQFSINNQNDEPVFLNFETITIESTNLKDLIKRLQFEPTSSLKRSATLQYGESTEYILSLMIKDSNQKIEHDILQKTLHVEILDNVLTIKPRQEVSFIYFVNKNFFNSQFEVTINNQSKSFVFTIDLEKKLNERISFYSRTFSFLINFFKKQRNRS